MSKYTLWVILGPLTASAAWANKARATVKRSSTEAMDRCMVNMVLSIVEYILSKDEKNQKKLTERGEERQLFRKGVVNPILASEHVQRWTVLFRAAKLEGNDTSKIPGENIDSTRHIVVLLSYQSQSPQWQVSSMKEASPFFADCSRCSSMDSTSPKTAWSRSDIQDLSMPSTTDSS